MPHNRNCTDTCFYQWLIWEFSATGQKGAASPFHFSPWFSFFFWIEFAASKLASKLYRPGTSPPCLCPFYATCSCSEAMNYQHRYCLFIIKILPYHERSAMYCYWQEYFRSAKLVWIYYFRVNIALDLEFCYTPLNRIVSISFWKKLDENN